MPHPPLYLVTPYKGVDIDKRERRHRTPKQNRQTMKINEILSPSIRHVLKGHKMKRDCSTLQLILLKYVKCFGII